MNNDIALHISGKTFHCVLGCIVNEEFSETLDSATVILDDVRERLSIAPYDFARIENMSEGYSLNKEMLVDSFVETETNIAQHIYSYQINLMSETKLLEKKQLPNLTISHSLRFGKRSIAEHIDRYLKLYMPKVKMLDKATGKWKYDRIIRWDKSELSERFGNDCADMAMQMPTLRQLLTNLMLQNGCIPMVSERKLTWLDLNSPSSVFNRNAKGMNKTQRSNASDSYVNALNSQNSQILDTGNTVISETLGFRDPSNVFLKKQDNLKLHTAFPIYKVTSCRLVMPVYISKQYRLNSLNYNVSGSWLPTFTMDFLNKDGTRPTASISTQISKIILNYTQNNANAQIKNAKIVYLKRKAPGLEDDPYVVFATQPLEIALPSSGAYQLSVDVPDEVQADEDQIYFYFISTAYNERGEEEKQGTMLTFLHNAYQIISGVTVIYPILPNTDDVIPFGYLQTDFTPCVVENTKRQLLDTDFTTMPDVNPNDPTPAKTISKWIYGTVGYSIGSNDITGFSTTYSMSAGWWQETYTYFENMLRYLFPQSRGVWHSSEDGSWKDGTIAKWREFLGGYEGGFALRQDGYYNDNFANALFDVMYQPLNDLTLKTYKEDVPLELEQLDNTAQGLTDFDRYALNEQQKADRLGNDVISVNQTTDDEASLQSLNSKDEFNNIAFRRSIAISKNHVQVTYNLSKDYVLKNYFTSITTKYRAYEHIDYSQSTLRKEHINVFVTLDTENHQGEDERLLYLGKPTTFFEGLTSQDDSKKVRYILERGTDETDTSLVTVKYDVSIVASDRALAFVWQSQFNVGNGSYLKALEATNGGLPQAYQIWGDSYYDNKEVGAVAKLPLYEEASEQGLLTLAREPIVDNKYMDEAIFKVRDSAEHIQIAQYKDEGEKLNTTLQLTYVNKAKDFLFTEEMIRNMPFARISEYGGANAVVVFERSKDFTLKPYPNTEGRLLADDEGFIVKPSDLIEIKDETITVKTLSSVYVFDFNYKIVHAYKKADGSYEWVDIAGFKGKTTEVLYAYLNDTNTQKVFSEDEHGVLRITHEDSGEGDKGTKRL